MIWDFLAAIVGRLPFPFLSRPGAALGWLAGCALRIRRAHATAALRRAGVDHPHQVARRVYRNLATNVFEFLWLSAHDQDDLTSLIQVDPEQWARVQACLARGRGAVVATAHTGNWDLLACAMASRVPLTVVSKHLSWRSADTLWQRSRARRGVSIIEAQGALQAGARVLRDGGVIAFMIDQAPERRTGIVRLPFLGAPAWHDAAFAVLALRYRAPVVVVTSERTPEGRHVLRIEEIIEPADGRSRTWVEETCRRASQAIERFVREHPSQWLWLHRRWKDAG